MTVDAPGSASQRRTGPLVAGSLLAALWFGFVFFLAFPAAVLWWSGADFRPPPGITRWIGGAIIVGAHALLLPPVGAFVRKGRGTQVPIAPPDRLIVSGFYTRVRNPMYLLYVVVALGEAVLFRSAALAVYAAALFVTAHLYVVQVEEKVLLRRFGSDYDAYCRRVGRWLPRR